MKSPRRPATGKSTINDVARLAGVSKKTVSRVLNDSPLVHAETRAKVRGVIDSLSYVPDPQARGLAFRRSFLVGLVFDSPSAQYIVNLQYGVLDALRDTPYELLVHPCDSRQPDYVAGIRRFVQRHKLHGVILVPRVSEDQDLAETLAALDCRYVRIASVPLDSPGRQLRTHDREAGAAAARHLLSLGHRRFGLVTGPARYRSAIERGEGFRDALAAAGATLADTDVVEGGYTFETGAVAAETLLARADRPTAVFASNDEMAAGVYSVSHRLGLRIPQDLSVVGYDDSDLASQLWPGLTTLHLPVRQIGRQAAERLLRAEDAALPDDEVFLELVVRGSTAPPAR